MSVPVLQSLIAKMPQCRQLTWIVELLDHRVREELEDLPSDRKARVRRIVELIQTQGLERVREPHVKYLENGLWEIRMTRCATWKCENA